MSWSKRSDGCPIEFSIPQSPLGGLLSNDFTLRTVLRERRSRIKSDCDNQVALLSVLATYGDFLIVHEAPILGPQSVGPDLKTSCAATRQN